jgi:hypothetical protein
MRFRYFGLLAALMCLGAPKASARLKASEPGWGSRAPGTSVDLAILRLVGQHLQGAPARR